jgi:Zn-dependent protease with chaperone function
VGRLREDGRDVERVRRILTRLAPPYVEAAQLRVYVVDNREWNAAAMGNFSVYVWSGLLREMDDDELAIVLGHELAHATHEHTRRQFRKAMWVQIAALGVMASAERKIEDEKARALAQLLTLFVAAAYRNGYGRELEDQADRVGLRYAYEAGYDVARGPGLWRRFARRYGEPSRSVNFFFGNHSLASARATLLEREIALNYPEARRATGTRSSSR